MLSAIVLAAGSSKRMGNKNKLLLPYRNSIVIVATIENILAAGIEEVIVVTGFESEKIKASIQHLPIKITYNKDHATGMTSSIQCGVHKASGEGFMICLADMVLITSAEYALLKNDFEVQYQQNSKCICIPRYNKEKGNPVIFSSYYRQAILQHQDPEGCKEIVQSNKETIHWIDMTDDHVLQDMDHLEDYEKLVRE
jgi:molybdenum cofactor cytidylyltransferase